MKRIILVSVLAALLLSGCLRYTSGQSYGYVTTVEGGIFWSRAWFRAELESSQTDCYLVQRSNDDLKAELRAFAEQGQRVKLQYARHLVAAQIQCSFDEIVKVSPAPKKP